MTRSPGTLVLAWYMVAAMWALALVVAVVAGIAVDTQPKKTSASA